ncbi:bifunctional diguanylate cyclase/phosphodiesterase [Catenovulum sediminis]|uniref:EAL domain-containing protein n=1 Tax=Catenovulum sediminis TaxID=1740262 RepID=A0ABV1RL22_9ALTE
MQWFNSRLIHSLSIKASVLVLCVSSVIGLVAGFALMNSQNKLTSDAAIQDVQQLSSLQANIISQHLSSLARLGEVSHRQLVSRLNSRYTEQSASELHFNKLENGAYRARSGEIGVFVGASGKLTTAEIQMANKLVSVWHDIANAAIPSFSSYFFISSEQLSVTYPAKLAEQLPATHNFEEDIFYRIGTPKYNPTRQPIWTPVYFDDIQNQWLTSLIIPVYIQGEFVGVVGGDFILQQLNELIISEVDVLTGRQIFVFDNSGNLIYYPDFKHVLSHQDAKLNTELNNFQSAPSFLQEIIREALIKGRFESESTFVVTGDKRVSVSPISDLNWYVGAYDKFEPFAEYTSKLQLSIFFAIAAAALLLSLLVFWFLNQFVLARLRIMFDAFKEHQQGQFELKGLVKDNDEIGQVARSMMAMSSEISGLIEGLNEKIIEKEIAELAALKLSNAVKHSETAIAITDENFIIEFVNPKFIELCGREEDELIGATLKTVIDNQMAWMLDAAYEQLNMGHTWKGDLLLTHSNGESIWVSQTVSPMTEDINGGRHFVAATQDISQIKKNQKKMEKLAYHDPLTNLYNRTFFKAQLTKSLEMTKRGHFSFALFYFDLDQFKRVNDTLGHEAGDELLIEIAKRLVRRLRAEDTIARLGGDEFAVILSGVATVERATAMAIDIQNVIREPVQLSGAEVLVSASIGITMSPKDAMSIETLLRNADLAMYRAKAAGRNTHYFFTDDLDKAVKESLLIESELRVALRELQFELYYQPQVDLKTGKLFGFEALIRWNHPERGMVSPAIFISVAEQSGLIVELGEWVLAEASMFIARLNEKYNENYTVAVNLSARQFKDKGVASVIRSSIINARIKPEWLDIELTESMLMGDISEALHQLDDIKALGVQMSIDDFGTGYSSLSYLKKFPVDTLKVDRAFIKDIPEDTDDMAISDAIIAMAHKLKMKVIAEGVETPEHVEFLIKNNCQIGQGYLFSPPLSEEKLHQFIETEQKNYEALFCRTEQK